jgi:hypothetical protein
MAKFEVCGITRSDEDRKDLDDAWCGTDLPASWIETARTALNHW